MMRSADVTYFATTLAAVILSLLCLALPIFQWQSLPDGWVLKVASGTAAFGIGLCKITFIPLGFEGFNQKRYFQAVILILVALFCLSISTISSRDLLQSVTEQKQQKLANGNLSYKRQQDEVNRLSREIDTLEKLIDVDQQRNYRKRAYEKLEALDQLKLTLSEKNAQLESLFMALESSSTGRYVADLNLVTSRFSIHLSGPLIAALMLHICCVVCVCASTVWRLEPRHHKHKSQSVYSKNKQKKRGDHSPANSHTNSSEMSQEQQSFYDDILNGRFGRQIVMRDMIQQKAIKGGYKKIKPVFNRLMDEKKITQKKRFYELNDTPDSTGVNHED